MAFEDDNIREADRMIRQIFVPFMANVTMFEDVGKKGGYLLSEFHREVELLRRPPLDEGSELLSNILKRNENDRLRHYRKTGCRHFHMDTQATIKLHNSLQGLKTNLEEAQCILKRLKKQLDDAVKLMQETTVSILRNMPLRYEEYDSRVFSMQGEKSTDTLEISDFVTTMSIIFNMLRQDYSMQEKVVSDLQLSTSSEVLESYVLMWNLHPFIEEHIILKASLWL